MARAYLRWSLTELASASGVGRATAARFELGEPVGERVVAAMRNAVESAGAAMIDKGAHAGGVYPTDSRQEQE
jgi:transcriptional regulator with XRE-family HTH domain